MLNLLNKAGHRRTAFLPVACFALLGACVFAAGCGSKAPDAAAVAPTSQKGVAPVVPTTGATPTPEQEAAKQKAIQEGPAMRAALDAQQNGPPAPK